MMMKVKGVVMSRKIESPGEISPYISPSELAERWRCARSSVDRIAGRAGMNRLYLGDGKNGIVRYVRKEVEIYETSRLMK
jgi:hypothetical protein